jgi:homocysteine S-methyltransferase
VRLGDVTDRELAQAEYRRFAELLLAGGADVILLETFTSVSEARLALAGLVGIEAPVWLSVVAGEPVAGSNRPDGTRLLSGETFAVLAELIDDPQVRRPDLLALNCTQIDAVPAALASMLDAIDPAIPLGLSPHLGRRRYDGVWVDRIIEPEVFAEQMLMWLKPRPRFVLAGACCGSNPDYIAALRRYVQASGESREAAQVRLAQLLP